MATAGHRPRPDNAVPDLLDVLPGGASDPGQAVREAGAVSSGSGRVTEGRVIRLN